MLTFFINQNCKICNQNLISEISTIFLPNYFFIYIYFYIYFTILNTNLSHIGFGYVPQTPWLQRGTIRDNIIWGSVFDEQWYKAVVYACALNDDLELLGSDLTGIGENGRTLSGGQRARVALARAVYQDKKSKSHVKC